LLRLNRIAHKMAAEEDNLIKKAWDGTVNAGKGIVDGAKGAGEAVAEGAKTAVTDPAKFAEDSKNNVVGGVQKAADMTTEGAKMAVDKTTEGAKMAMDKTTEGATMVATATVDGAKKVGDVTVEGSKKGLEMTMEGAKKGAEMTMAGYKMTSEKAQELMGGFSETFEKLGVNKGFQSVLSLGQDLDTSDESLEAQFKSIDADSSDKISPDEMKGFITKFYGKELDGDLMDKMMTAADTNKDGEIDIAEFKAIMRAGPEKEAKPDIMQTLSCGTMGRGGCAKAR